MTTEASAIFRGFARAVRRTPHACALTFAGRDWSYHQLSDAAVGAAHLMTKAGVHAGDRVAFFARNSDAYAIGWLASQYLGAVHVPINFMLGAVEVAYILDHASPKVLFASEEFRVTAEAAIAAAGPAVRQIPIEDLAVASFSGQIDLGLKGDGTRVAQLAYTSGTESAPKGALLTDDGLMHEYVSCLDAGEYTQSDIMLHALPLYHCAQMHCFLMPHLLLGARNLLLDRADPGEIIQTIRQTGATSFFAPPTIWIGILNHPTFRADELRSLQKGFYGASIMPTEVLRSLREKLPWMRLWNYYGQTEIGPLATVLRPEEHEDRPSSAGRPVLFVESRVVDDDMNDVPPGTIGEIVHRSPQLLQGYYRDPLKTAEAFRGGWFHTGDLAVADAEGYLEIVDRKKDIINSGGENVSSREVEEMVYTHPAVAEVAVIGLPDPKWVERVCAVVTLRPGTNTNEKEIIACTSGLASFKRPKQVIFVTQLPKNPSGKILKRELRSTLSERPAGLTSK
jgi:fatty-acyl-CoA synthase